MLDNMETYGKFIGAKDSFEEAEILIIGIPMDYTVSYRPGSRNGPQRIREVSYGLEEYSFFSDEDLRDVNYYDCGDIVLPFGNVSASLEAIEKTVSDALTNRKKILSLGGEHLVTWPIVKAYSEKYKDLAVIQFDAHADLRTDYMGEKYSHASVMRLICEKISGENVYQFGIRSGERYEREYAKENTNMFCFDILDKLPETINKLGDRSVYLTIDIDVLDPAFAPGTGTPEPGGATSNEIFEALKMMSSLNLVGADVVEVSPLNDVSDITSIVASKLVRELLFKF